MIIDAHVHCYDPTRPQGIPHPARENPLLYRPMLPEDLRAVAEPAGVTGAVFIECSPWLEDNQWALDLAARTPFLRAVVGNLDPTAEDFPAQLDRFAANPLFRGIRTRPFPFGHPRLRANLRRLVDAGLTLDALLRPPQLPQLVALARDLPELRIMLDHLGQPPITGGPPDAAWLEALRPLADLPNVHCKVSALAESAVARPAPVDPAHYAPVIAAAEQVFGEDRLVFASNWPPCLQACGYATAVSLATAFFSSRPAAAAKVLSANAAAFYGGPRLLPAA